MTDYDTDLVPDSLTIHLARAKEAHPYWEHYDFEATSVEFPGLSGISSSPATAVDDLIQAVLDAQPLAPDLVAAFVEAGHSPEVVAAWDTYATGHLRAYRHNAGAAIERLDEFTEAGVPALTAIEYLHLGAMAATAATAHAAGSTPTDLFEYIRASETDKWWKWDFEVDPWFESGIPFERGRLYVFHCEVEVARGWEGLVERHGVPDEIVSLALRSKMLPEEAAAHLEVAGNDANTLSAEAERRIPIPATPCNVSCDGAEGETPF